MATGLLDYQFSYRGITFNNDVYTITRIDGLEDNKVRRGDRDFPQSHGQLPGRHLATAKTITIYLDIHGGNDEIRALRRVMSPDQGTFDSSVANPRQDRLRFKLRGDKERYMFARPLNLSIPLRTSSQYGVQNAILQFIAVDPRVYAADLEESDSVNTRGNSTWLFSVTHNGFSRAYPRLYLQLPQLIERRKDSDGRWLSSDTIASRLRMRVTNYGPDRPSGGSESWADADPGICNLTLENLLDISDVGFDEGTGSYTKTVDDETITLQSYFRPDRWDNATRPPTNTRPNGRLPKEEAAASIIYTCDMQNYIRGSDDLVIWRNSFRNYWQSGTASNPTYAKATDNRVDYPGMLVNEYAKWALPREPFFLIPGENWIRTTTYTILTMAWRDTDL